MKPAFRLRPLLGDMLPARWIFVRVFKKHFWGTDESVSGSGSRLAQTVAIREALPALLRDIKAKTVLDAPCGDFNWMKEVKLELDQYIGGDIVPQLISQVQDKYGNSSRQFVVLDIIKDKIPTVDLIICRDGLVHLSQRKAVAAIKNFKQSKSTYLAATTFPGIAENKNGYTGPWRALDLELPPFNFPKPLKLIDEKNPKFQKKSLGVWRLEDIHT